MREKKKSLRTKMDVCRLVEVFAIQKVPSSAVTGFSATAGLA